MYYYVLICIFSFIIHHWIPGSAQPESRSPDLQISMTHRVLGQFTHPRWHTLAPNLDRSWAQMLQVLLKVQAPGWWLGPRLGFPGQPLVELRTPGWSWLLLIIQLKRPMVYNRYENSYCWLIHNFYWLIIATIGWTMVHNSNTNASFCPWFTNNTAGTSPKACKEAFLRTSMPATRQWSHKPRNWSAKPPISTNLFRRWLL